MLQRGTPYGTPMAGPMKKGPDHSGPSISTGDLGSALRIAAVDRSDLGDHLAIDHGQLVARLVVHADGAFVAIEAVGHVITHGLVLAAQRDPATRLAAGAHRAGGAIGIPIGHVVGNDARRLGGRSLGVALLLGVAHHLVFGVVLFNRAPGESAADRASDRRQLATLATPDLVADQATGCGAADRAANIAGVTSRRLLLHHDVIADLVRRRRRAGLAYRIGTDDLGVQLLLLAQRLDVDDLRVLHAAGVVHRLVVERGITGSKIGLCAGGRGFGSGEARMAVAAVLKSSHGHAADQQ